MNSLRYEPLASLYKIQGELSKLFNDEADNGSCATSQWTPHVDIKETADSFELYFDVPGVAAKDIDISMEEGVLTIKGSRETVKEEDSKRFARTERISGSFFRRFSLPDTADGSAIQATARHGVLHLLIPKCEPDKARRITVEVAE